MITPVILSGGAGTRLWPLSRKSKPKQLIALVDQDHTMMQATLARVNGPAFSKPMIIASAPHRFLIAEQLRALGQDAHIILEPEGRNTAPAIALAIALAQQKDPEATLLVLPSDHVVEDVAAFHEAIESAAQAAQDQNAIVTFGIHPHRPETGFGYIQLGEDMAKRGAVKRLKRFVEKPDGETAKAYLDSGDYVWNAGMFLFKSDTVAAAFQTHAPDVLACADAALKAGSSDSDFIRPDSSAFAQSPNISFDYAIMEKISNGAVAPCDIGWSDVGSFEGLLDVLDKDDNGNAVVGDVTARETSGSLLYSAGPAIAATGLTDIALIATPDVVLALPKSKSQDVKVLVDLFKSAGRLEATQHPGDEEA